MASPHIGDYVTFRDRAYFVRGMSPMGVALRRVQLEDLDSGESIEAFLDDIQRDALEDGASAASTDPTGEHRTNATQ